MSQVLGKNINIYVNGEANNSLFLIGCEETCNINFNTEIINTTTRGSGRARGREYGLYDVTIQSTGVIFINSTALPSTTADPMFFASALLEGKKCIVKYEVTDGTNTRYYIGQFIIQSAVYTGNATGFGTYDVSLLNDGELYKTDDLKLTTDTFQYIYEATGTVDGFSATVLENANLFFVYRYGLGGFRLYESIQTLANSGDIPTGTDTVGYHAASGTVNFEAALANGETIIIGANP